MRILKQLTVLLCLLSMLFVGCSPTTPHEDTTATESLTTSIETEPVPDDGVIIPILMFHDVKTYAGGTWSMSAENFRNTLIFLSDNGYTPVSFGQLVDYVDGVSELPEKPVCITLDDGYFSNYRNVLPIITELNDL